MSNYSIPDNWVLMKDTNMSPDLKALSLDRETDMFLRKVASGRIDASADHLQCWEQDSPEEISELGVEG